MAAIVFCQANSHRLPNYAALWQMHRRVCERTTCPLTSIIRRKWNCRTSNCKSNANYQCVTLYCQGPRPRDIVPKGRWVVNPIKTFLPRWFITPNLVVLCCMCFISIAKKQMNVHCTLLISIIYTVDSTEWPYLCCSAIKKLHTHSLTHPLSLAHSLTLHFTSMIRFCLTKQIAH